MTSISIADYKKLYAPKRTKRRTTVKKERVVSEGEARLIQHLKAYGIQFEQEFKFHPERKWKADFRIEGYPILVEVEGGVFSGGRHTRGKGYSADCEKYSAAAILGWVVIRGTTEQVKKGIVVGWIEEAIKKVKV